MKFKRLNVIISKKHIIIASLTLLLGVAIFGNYLYSTSLVNKTDEGVSSEKLPDETKANYGDVQFVAGDTSGRKEVGVEASARDVKGKDDILKDGEMPKDGTPTVTEAADVPKDSDPVAAEKADIPKDVISDAIPDNAKSDLPETEIKKLSASDEKRVEEYFAAARLDKKESRDEAVELLKSMYQGGDTTDDEQMVIATSAATMGKQIESESKIETLIKAAGFEDVLCYLTATSANIIVKSNGLTVADAAKIKNALLSEIKIPAENITIVEIN